VEETKYPENVCSLCLKVFTESDTIVESYGRLRHKECQDKFEEGMVELSEIYEKTCPQDI